MRHQLLLLFTCFISLTATAQQTVVTGAVEDAQTREPLGFCNISVLNTTIGTMTDEKGRFKLSLAPDYANARLVVSFLGYQNDTLPLKAGKTQYQVNLKPSAGKLNEVVVTGTMKEMSRLESPVPVEVYTPGFFRKNPTPSLFEAVGLVNGVRPQLNCNVCNTGDIHINGMEGAYTMILIDGMPIVSSLSTVYGLNGIPNSLVERLEVVKGPAGALYGSEAMGGIINVITKSPLKAPRVSVDVFGTSWREYNTDASVKFKVGEATSLLGVNYFRYQNPEDKNEDGFTDVTLQQRISLFNKWDFARAENRQASMAVRYVYEDRWGGQMGWTRQHRGGQELYGESIYTKRWEVLGLYQLPVREKVMAQVSFNGHHQNSFYGSTPFHANQRVAFGQLYWDKQLGLRHSLLAGAALRYTHYDDNTPATATGNASIPQNQPMVTPLPGVFVQDEWTLTEKHKLLLGYRYDYDRRHGHIQSPRVAYKWAPDPKHTLRASFGTGYRVVSLFTEDHAALTGAREVVIAEALQPEESINSNLNYVFQVPAQHYLLTLDLTGFYSRFSNKIIGDFDTDPQKIIYDNLRGHAVSRGATLNLELSFYNPLKLMAGVTYLKVYQKEADAEGQLQKTVQLHAPEWAGNFLASYTFHRNYTVDLTGTWSGPMRLPVVPHDFRPEYSPWFSLVNVQVTKKVGRTWDLYGGVKNLLNFVPQNPILRSFDPFDRTADDPVTNPHGYTFDPSYNYAPLQGTRVFLGVRYTLL
ncbi:TonB-dependent receptor domain-containing protein [Rufibacter glacialis]|uniref:TonB-dependent receptor n=1 Tax=Rufibacter glacialis TaxID=1259555 RepID=A0A5M8QUD0_9BACT|nr:TonB-dependent receptor [Rufibacter glacialis]KAA6437782.1 TonB-dependent receptor [Rufibacter glacialis]GGK56270.1 TonB-dependent receptor [Rufibacter glacialis]